MCKQIIQDWINDGPKPIKRLIKNIIDPLEKVLLMQGVFHYISNDIFAKEEKKIIGLSERLR